MMPFIIIMWIAGIAITYAVVESERPKHKSIYRHYFLPGESRVIFLGVHAVLMIPGPFMALFALWGMENKANGKR